MLEAAAENAELTSQIRSLLAWIGPGRKLTQTGRIGLADARHLVELLGTGDTIDPEIGGRVFKTRSSEDLAHLNRIVEWAKAARLVRVSGTKLMAVKKNAALAERRSTWFWSCWRPIPGSASRCSRGTPGASLSSTTSSP